MLFLIQPPHQGVKSVIKKSIITNVFQKLLDGSVFFTKFLSCIAKDIESLLIYNQLVDVPEKRQSVFLGWKNQNTKDEKIRALAQPGYFLFIT
ncbi:hypothetical protein BZZ01_11830 [Nostocales cyanobacterium HT-58-2]|nr:hypothetical protein BZZ01_11830 [Nostocales cyanobacterium HT-58-2]